MIDPFIVMWLGLGCVLISSLIMEPLWGRLINAVAIIWFALFAISYSAGFPTNITFPEKAIVYGLTSKEVWAGTPDDPTPRAYIFKAPPEWFEERDKRSGQAFEVERKGDEEKENDRNGDRYSEGEWNIIEQQLPPKDG